MRWGGLVFVAGFLVACDQSASSSGIPGDREDAEAGVSQANPGNEAVGDGGATTADAASTPDGSTTTTTTTCVRFVTPEKNVTLNVTGRITFRGQPRSGLARFRERQTGALAAEASVNDAGYFLLAVRSIYDPNQCGNYWIEITGGDGPPIFGERDANDLVRDAWNAASGAKQNVDISSTPIPVESTQ